MSKTAHSLLLADDWDLHVDASGNLPQVYDDYAIAQNVANTFRLFTDDAYFFPERGIAHFLIELNKHPLLNVLKVRLRDAALKVEHVTACKIELLNLDPDTRDLSGVALLTLDNAHQITLNF